MSRLFAWIEGRLAFIGVWLKSPLLLILRLFFGIGFIYAGFSKIQDIHSFIDYLRSVNIPYPEFSAWAAALTEFIGGIFLTIGFLSRFASIFLIIAMCVAYSTAHIEAFHQIFQDPQALIHQPPFGFLLTALLVFAFGPGYFSLDHHFVSESKSK